MQHQRFKPTQLREIVDLVKNLPIGISNPKRNVVILRGEKKSFSIFLRKSNNLEDLKEFLHVECNVDIATIDARINYFFSNQEKKDKY